MPTRSVLEVLENSQPVIVEHNTPISDVVKAMIQYKEDAALIVKNDKTVGIVTESDLVRRVLMEEGDIKMNPIESIMTSDTVIIRPERLFGQALYLMHEYNVKHIPVVDKGKPIGVVSLSDALISDLQTYAHDAEMLDHIAEII